MLALAKQDFIECYVNDKINIFQIIINTWGFALLLDVGFGALNNPFDGGLVTILFFVGYALSILGKETIIPYAVIGMLSTLFIKIWPIFQFMLADERLYIPGFFGIVSMFLSLSIQFKNFIPQLIKVLNVIPLKSLGIKGL